MRRFLAVFLAGIGVGSGLSLQLARGDVDPRVLQAEEQRIEAIARASRATVAVFDGQGGSGGSAVLISPDGFALTNFHVVAPCGVAMKCGLNDGMLYDAVVVGIDPVGDVALIQLLGRDDFPVAQIGDSDQVRVGDWAFAAGNPFLLADDFTPSISYGMISGVHRYQYPAGTLLEYADCIQTDAAINPGNSGGPLFDARGELIGVNGRGSFEKRGRVNVGVGYAISINQILRFLGHLKSGRIVDHAALGATVATDDQGRVVIDEILESSDAYRRGLRYGDQVVRFAGRQMDSANTLKNALGIFPSGWPVPISFRREDESWDTSVRLTRLHDRSQLIDMVQQERQRPSRPPDDAPKENERDQGEDEAEEKPELPKIPGLPGLDQLRQDPKLPELVAARFEARRGYANYWYNQQAQQRLWSAYEGVEALADAGYSWQISGRLGSGQEVFISTLAERADIRLPWGQSGVLLDGDLTDQLSPPRSGGLLLTIHLWQRLLDKGLRQYGEVYFLGQLPTAAGAQTRDCLVGIYAGMETRFFFDGDTGDLIKIENFSADDRDPCELTLLDYAEFDGRRLPTRWIVEHGDSLFADLTVEQYSFVPPAAKDED